MTDGTERVPSTFESLKGFVDSQLKVLEQPIVMGDDLARQVCERYNLSDAELRKLLKSLDVHLKKRYKGTFFTHQSRVDIVDKVMKVEMAQGLKRRRPELGAQELLLIFNSDGIPDLNGAINAKTVDELEMSEDEDYDEDSDEDANVLAGESRASKNGRSYDANNVNINGGLTSLREDEILGIVDELPKGSELPTEDEDSVDEYENIRSRLKERVRQLQIARERLAAYKRVRAQVQFLEDPAKVSSSVQVAPEQLDALQAAAETFDRRVGDGTALKRKLEERLLQR